MKTKSAEIEENNSICDEELQGVVFAKRGCCFWKPRFKGRSSSEPMNTAARWEKISSSPVIIIKAAKERWWSERWMKIRDRSVIVAGSKWKTFIRRFHKKPNNFEHAQFHYDPLSYSLNFDEDPGRNRNLDDDFVHRDFSARFASVPTSAKSSMDLGKDCTSFS